MNAKIALPSDTAMSFENPPIRTSALIPAAKPNTAVSQ
jgi:hypothetical protein